MYQTPLTVGALISLVLLYIHAARLSSAKGNRRQAVRQQVFVTSAGNPRPRNGGAAVLRDSTSDVRGAARRNKTSLPDFDGFDPADFSVVSVWINLEGDGAAANLRHDHSRKLTKHGYNLTRTITIPAPYYIFCDKSEEMVAAREPASKWGPTAVDRGWTMSKLVTEVASQLQVPEDQLWSAAQQSVWAHDRHAKRGRCPSAELILIWLSKPFFVARYMKANPSYRAFAYVVS